MIISLTNNENVETEDLNEKDDKVEKSKDAATIIKEYEDIIRTKKPKKNNVYSAYHQGNAFWKFKDKGKFINVIKGFKVHKTRMNFKKNIVKLIDKHPSLRKSSATLTFKDIKKCVAKI